MPRDIMRNLSEFATILLNRIAVNSEKGGVAFAKNIISAQKAYDKPIESWITGWVYQYSRLRGPEINGALKDIGAFPDPVSRLKVLKRLIEKGGWDVGLFNYYLFIELIKSVPGYKPLEENFVLLGIIKLKEIIIERIDAFIDEQKANQASASKARKPGSSSFERFKTVDHIMLASNFEEAQDAAKKNPDKLLFCINLKNKRWELTCFDFTGKAYKLLPGQELIDLLDRHKTQGIGEVMLQHADKIKRECSNARDVSLQKIQLLINPQEDISGEDISNTTLSASGTVSTFVLRGKPNQYTLDWFDFSGKLIEISLRAYPEFKKWLDAQNSLKAEHTPQLKTFLVHVNPTKALSGVDDIKKKIETCLFLVPSSNTAASSATKVEKRNRLELSLFSGVEKCLSARQTKKQTPSTEPKTKSNKEDASRRVFR